MMEASGEKEDEDGGAEESLPMMHWEELSARIEELERQERSIQGSVGCGLKQEVVMTLRRLRDKRLDELRRENQEQSPERGARTALGQPELEPRSGAELRNLRTSLQREAHGLSAELVSVLLVRDQLRTEQEALLLDLLDLT